MPPQRRFKFAHGGLDSPRDIECVRPRLLLDNQQQTRSTVDDRITYRRRVVDDDVRHIMDPQRSTVVIGDDDLTQSLGRVHGRHMPNRESLIGGVQESSCSDGRRVANGAEHSVEGQAVSAQTVWIDHHLQLRVLLTPHGHIGHAGHRHQTRSNRPARYNGHVHLGLHLE